jgi:hypothetical protein
VEVISWPSSGGEFHTQRRRALFNIKLETRAERWVPDITASLQNGATVFIEIYVTHQVDGEKSEKLDNLLEIDLSSLTETTVTNMTLLKDEVLSNAPRKWHRCSLYDELPHVKKTRNALWDKLEDEKKRRREEREKKLNEDKREAEMLSNKERMRQYYSEPLANLKAILSPESILARQDELANGERYLKTKKWVEEKIHTNSGQACKFPTIIDVPLNGDWIFNVHRLVWQSYLLFWIIFKKRKGFILHAGSSLKEIEHRYGILPWVVTLDKLKRDQKSQGRSRKQWYADEGAWFLDHEENRAIISPYRLIIEYLSTLSQPHIGVLSRIHDTPRFTVQTKSLDEFYHFQEKRTKESELRMERLLEQQRLEEELEKRKEQDKQKQREDRDQEAKQCAADLEAIFYAGETQGSFCPCCRATFSSAVDKCSECGQRQIRTLQLSESELDTLYHRIRCCPCINS